MNGIDDFATRAEEERNLSLLTLSKYLLLAECKVRTASYGPSFFLSFYGLSVRAMKTRKEKTRILVIRTNKRG